MVESSSHRASLSKERAAIDNQNLPDLRMLSRDVHNVPDSVETSAAAAILSELADSPALRRAKFMTWFASSVRTDNVHCSFIDP